MCLFGFEKLIPSIPPRSLSIIELIEGPADYSPDPRTVWIERTNFGGDCYQLGISRDYRVHEAHFLFVAACGLCACSMSRGKVMLSAFAILLATSSVGFLTPRSTMLTYVGCSPAVSASFS